MTIRIIYRYAIVNSLRYPSELDQSESVNISYVSKYGYTLFVNKLTKNVEFDGP